MQPIYQQLIHSDSESILVLDVQEPHFIVPWHCHAEFEILFVKKGSGTRFVGDHIESFAENDLVLIGPELPHVWRNDEDFYDKQSRKYAHAQVIFFHENTFGSSFWNLKEMGSIKILLQNATKGVKFKGKGKQQLINTLNEIALLSGINRLLKFWQLLALMANDCEFELLTSNRFNDGSRQNHDEERLSRIIEYIVDNYRNEIGLNDVAQKANMTPTSFCRYFKKRTNKTLNRFVNELRVGHACKLLQGGNDKIAFVSSKAGFSSLTNFNEQFKLIKGISPIQYRRKL